MLSQVLKYFAFKYLEITPTAELLFESFHTVDLTFGLSCDQAWTVLGRFDGQRVEDFKSRPVRFGLPTCPGGPVSCFYLFNSTKTWCSGLEHCRKGCGQSCGSARRCRRQAWFSWFRHLGLAQPVLVQRTADTWILLPLWLVVATQLPVRALSCLPGM